MSAVDYIWQNNVCYMGTGATPPSSPVAQSGDAFYDTTAQAVLLFDGTQWLTVAQDVIFPEPCTITSENGLWLINSPPSLTAAIDEFIEENNISAIRREREFIFREFEDAALIKLKFQQPK
jgi:hypothetical protein